MDWITGIQKAVDYVEEHITEEIDYEEVAKRAYSSSFHFQRTFAVICGFTLGEYVRNRRLSLAGNELLTTDAKVIDVALKYGYDAPESFSRAFTRFHGIAPSQVKKGTSLKSYSRLFVKLILNGGTTMDYRIETKESFQLIAKKTRVSCKEELTTAEISNFWAKCCEDDTFPALYKYISEDNIFGKCIVGASFGKDASETDFPYGIGAPYNGREIEDKGFVVETIPKHTYIAFKCVGKMPEAFQTLYQKIYTEFFPASDYQPCGGVDFEAYPSADVSSPDYTCEIWISVEKKK